MRAAISTGFDYSIPFAQTVSLLKRAGFEVISLGSETKHSGYFTVEGRARIKRLTRENGLEIDSIHSPGPGWRLSSLDEEERREAIRQCRITIDAACDLGVETVVTHMVGSALGENHLDRMIDRAKVSVERLSSYALKQGVRIALENEEMQYAQKLLASILNEFTEDHIGLCYDSSHEIYIGECFQILEGFGHRLFTTHISDGREGKKFHLLPYEGNIDWDRFKTVFLRLDYSGNLLLEPAIKYSKFKDPEVFLAEAEGRTEKLLQPPSGL